MLFLLALLACPIPPSADDADADGSPWWEDCDDADAAVHPGAEERCEDDVDNDCDGEVDESDAAGGTTWYADDDGDGHGDAGQSEQFCGSRSGWVAEATDCDDSDPAVSPDATEVCDGVDNDCDGAVDDADPDLDLSTASTWYQDADSDGWGDESAPVLACAPPAGTVDGAGDCDPEDGARFPGADEQCADGQINDCSLSSASGEAWQECRLGGVQDVTLGALDGVVAFEVPPGQGEWHEGGAVALLAGQGAGGEAALVFSALVLEQTYTGDVASTPMGCHALLKRGSAGLPTDTLARPDLSLIGPETGAAQSSIYLRADADGDGDGLPELLVGCSKADSTAGALVLVPGELLAGVSDASLDLLAQAAAGEAAVVYGGSGDLGTGWASLITPGSDPRLLVGALWSNSFAGRVYQGPADLRGEHILGQGELTLLFAGAGAYQRAGQSIAAGDLDGDGVAEVLVGGDGYTDSGPYEQGRVWLLPGLDGGLVDPEDTVTVVGSTTGHASGGGDQLGQALVILDPANDGGAPWVAASARTYNAGVSTTRMGAVFLFPSSALYKHGTLEPRLGDTLDVESVATTQLHGPAGSNLGHSLALAGDLDGDGREELLVGSPREDDLDGAVYLVFGDTITGGGSHDIEEVAVRFGDTDGTAEANLLGRGLSQSEDVDGDGTLDLLFGARWGTTTTAEYSDGGGVSPAGYLVYGASGALGL